MNKDIVKRFCPILFFILIVTCLAQEESKTEDRTRFSDYPYSFRRVSTSEKDKTNGFLLPKYDEIASNREQGITLADWEKYFLPLERFKELDENNDGAISKEELDKDDYMGEASIHYQSGELIKKYCQKDIPEYKEKIRQMKQLGYKDIDREVSYVVNEKRMFQDQVPPLAIRSEYPGSNEVATKVYIQAKDGQLIKKKVDLGAYVYLLIQDQDKQDSLFLYFLFVMIVVVTAGVTLVVPRLSK